MPSEWDAVARRVVESFEIGPGGFVVVRDRCGRPEVVDAVVVAFELRGISTVVDPASDALLGALLTTVEPALLAGFGRHRAAVLGLADAVVTLGGGPPPTGSVPAPVLAAFRAARQVMSEVEDRRRLPYLAVAVPTPALAGQLGLPLTELDAAARRALATPTTTTRSAIDAAVMLAAGERLTLRTPGCALEVRRHSRAWLADDGHISGADVEQGAVVSNLPCGSIYTTVLDDSAHGTVRVPQLANAHDVVLTLTAGVVTAAEGPGAESVLRWLAGFDANAGRISHLGVGLNPDCAGGTGWTLLDEHRAGAVFLAFGENRYMGGTNASSLNHDVVLTGASLAVDATPLVDADRLVTADAPPAR